MLRTQSGVENAHALTHTHPHSVLSPPFAEQPGGCFHCRKKMSYGKKSKRVSATVGAGLPSSDSGSWEEWLAPAEKKTGPEPQSLRCKRGSQKENASTLSLGTGNGKSRKRKKVAAPSVAGHRGTAFGALMTASANTARRP